MAFGIDYNRNTLGGVKMNQEAREISKAEELRQRGKACVKRNFKDNWVTLVDKFLQQDRETILLNAAILEMSLQCMESLKNHYGVDPAYQLINKNHDVTCFNQLLSLHQKGVIADIVSIYHEKGALFLEYYKKQPIMESVKTSKSK